MRFWAIIGALVMLAMPGTAWANRYYFCFAYGVSGGKYTAVFGGVIVTRDGYRDGESRRMYGDFEAEVLRRYAYVRDTTCYNQEASDRSTRALMAKSADSYRQRGTPVVIVNFDKDYTGGVPSGSNASRAPGVYVVPPRTAAPATPPKPRTDGLTEAEIQRRNAAADADLAKVNASYQQQRARQEAEYARVKQENANRQAAYRAQVAKQQADYRAMLAAREAQAAKARAEWEARVARCKAGDKKSCASQAIER